MKPHTKNIISLFGFDAFARLLGFASTTYLARTLGNGTFGLINLGLAVFSYGLIISSPGLHIIGTRIVSQRSMNDSSVISRVTALRLVLACLTCAATALASFIFIHDTTIRCIVILYSASLLPSALQIEWFYQGRQDISIMGLSRITGVFLFVILLIFIVKSKTDVLLVPIAYFAGASLNAVNSLFSSTPKGKEEEIASNEAQACRPSMDNRFFGSRFP